MRTVIHNGHTIQIPGMTLSGREDVRYNGKIVSSKWSILGAEHQFEVVENGQPVTYEVKLGMRWYGCTGWASLKRQGELLFSDR
ncbi:MAG: hypothetical protein OXT73_06180 [Bacteroidota bacterium]|nr:hypothetical protein [Bacteroidota bacterium]